MIEKIISGGQTGADRAGLDVAIKFNIDHGGWIPKGRKTEDGPLADKYKLKEMTSADYRERTKQNIIDSQGTVILSHGELTGGSKLTLSYAKVIGRPNCHIDLVAAEEFEASIMLKSFITENGIRILNVAGPRLSHQPWIYRDVKTVLEAALYLLFLETRKDEELKKIIPSEPVKEDFPETIDASIEMLCEDLSLKSKSIIAKCEPENIQMLYFTLMEYIRHRLGFNTENKALLNHCILQETDDSISVEDAVMVILKRLKHHLEKDHILRVVK